MKKSNFLNLFTVMLFLSFSFIYTSCTSEEDKCDGIECGTGSCDDGTCVCVGNFTGTNCEKCKDGYDGADCNTELRAKFYGEYNIVRGNCTGDSFPMFPELDIQQNAENVTLVDVKLIEPTATNPPELKGNLMNDTIKVEYITVNASTYLSLFHDVNGDLIGTYRRLSASGNGGTCEIECTVK